MSNISIQQQEASLSEDEESGLKYVKLTMALLIVLLNGYAAIILLRIKHRAFSICLFISISVSDMLIGICVALPSALISSTARWPFSSLACYIYLTLRPINFMITVDTVFMLAIHRFIQLARPSRQSETISAKRILILLLPWLYRPIYCLINVEIVDLYHGIDTQTCSMSYDGFHVVLSMSLVEFPIILAAIVLNALNIYKIVERQRQVISRLKSPIVATVRKQSSLHKEHESSTGELSPMFINRNNESKLERRVSNSFNRDFKAITCISSIILNMMLTNCTFLIVLAYTSLCKCNYQLAEYSFIVALCCPLLNPIILFIFNSQLRAYFGECFSKNDQQL